VPDDDDTIAAGPVGERSVDVGTVEAGQASGA
jgi:hypothetical protein